MLDYLIELRKTCLDTFTGIIQGLKDDNSNNNDIQFLLNSGIKSKNDKTKMMCLTTHNSLALFARYARSLARDWFQTRRWITIICSLHCTDAQKSKIENLEFSITTRVIGLSVIMYSDHPETIKIEFSDAELLIMTQLWIKTLDFTRNVEKF